MLTVFLGDNDDSIVFNAKKYDPHAYLITHENCDNQHQGTVYTSISDLPNLLSVSKLLRLADKIIYSPPATTIWSDNKKGKSKLKEWTEYYLTVFGLDKNKKILNFNQPIANDLSTIVKLQDNRRTNKTQLWIAGCSISYGVGVEIEQRYGDILSRELNLPLSNLSESGSSILWAGDQILRSDIQKNDIVVWGLTSLERFPYYDFETKKINHVTPKNYSLFKDKMSLDFNLTYLAINKIFEVKNFCNKIGTKLVLAGLLTGLDSVIYLKDISEYIHLNNYWGVNHGELYIDLGDDNDHPGPEMHKWYAEKILEKLKSN
jgi:hypothetical protein